MRYTRPYNKSATTMVIASIQILSSTSWSPFKVACGHTISQSEQRVMLTTEAARDMNGILVAVQRSVAEQMKLPHSNISSYLNRSVSINKAR